MSLARKMVGFDGIDGLSRLSARILLNSMSAPRNVPVTVVPPYIEKEHCLPEKTIINQF